MSERRFSRRRLLRNSATAIGFGLVLASCARPAPAPEPAEPVRETVIVKEKEIVKEIVEVTPVPQKLEPVDLRVAWWGGHTRHNITIQVIRMFEELHPHIKMGYEFSGWSDYWTLLTTQAAAGSLPDIMQQVSQAIAEWADRGLLVPLDEYVQSGLIDVSDIDPELLRGGMLDGKLYAFNLGNNAIGFMLDLDAFESASVEVPSDNWTWEEFEGIATRLHEKLGIFGVGTGLTHIDIWYTLYLAYRKDLYAPDGKSLGYDDDTPLLEHLKMVMRLQEAGVAMHRAQEVSEFGGLGPEHMAVVQAKSAMDHLPGSNMLIAAWGAAGPDRRFRLVSIPIPKDGQQGTWIRPSQHFSITSHSKHPEEAAMFIDFFTNSIAANMILAAERGVPVSAKVREGIKEVLGPAQNETIDYISRLLPIAAPLPPPSPPGATELRDGIWYPELVDPVRYGRISPEEGVARFRLLANQVLSK